MKTIFTTILFLAMCKIGAFSQITFQGCTGILGAQNFILTQTGTTNDGGVIRNTYEATPNNFAQSCPAGVCELRIIWNVTLDRWEMQLDNDGPVATPDYTTAVLYFNSAASVPNPPDLTLGSWQNAGFCPDAPSALNGDVQSALTLPIELAYFKGLEEQNAVLLAWETATETNNDYFNVAKSSDGIEFTIIGKVDGVGTSGSKHNYTFIDANPNRGINYYRLQQVDFDNSSTVSPIIAVHVNKLSSTVQVYPSPATDIIHVNIDLSLETYDYRIVDIMGIDVLKGQFIKGTELHSIDISTLALGVYSLQILVPGKKELVSFVKQ